MIWLARHGETPYNAERRFQGQGPVPLSDRGREQASALAEEAARHEFASLWCSPLARARETADVVAARIGGQIGLRGAEHEPEVQASDPDRFAQFAAGDPTFAFPGGESFAAQQDRVCAALADIRAAGPGPALVVCHRNSMRLALERIRGRTLGLDEVPNGALVEL